MIGAIDGLVGVRGEVSEAELVRVRLPLVRAHRSAQGVEAVRDVVLVRVVRANGTEGWGECSALARPTYTAEHTAGAWAVLAQELVPALLAGRAAGVVGHPMAHAAVQAAVIDARLRATGQNLAEALADRSAQTGTETGSSRGLRAPRAALPVSAVVGLGGGVDDVMDRVAGHLADGVALIKLKVTPAVEDLRAVAAVRSTWPELALAVDWNQSADEESLAALADLGLAYVEQPGPADDPVTGARLAQRAGAPVALDESVDGLGSFVTAVALRCGSVLNLKPARVGGLVASLDLLAAARHAGWEVFVGGMLETGIGRAGALALAAQSALTLPTDLGPSCRYVERDLSDPIVVDDRGRVVVPDGPGIGVTVDPEAIDAATVDRASFAAPSFTRSDTGPSASPR